MLRNILAAVLGLVTAWIVFSVIQALGHLAFPPTVALDLNNQASINAFMASLSPAAFAVVLAGYAIGSLAGGFVIGKIAAPASNIIPISVGAILTFFWVMNLIMLPHPLWVAVVGFFMFIPFAILGKNLAGTKAGSDDDSAPEEEDEALIAGAGAEGGGDIAAASAEAVVETDEAVAEAGAEDSPDLKVDPDDDEILELGAEADRG